MNKLDEDGYEVLSVTPRDEGGYSWGRYAMAAVGHGAPDAFYSYG
jgi:hypothetical protein